MLSDPKKRKVYDQFGQYSDNLADAAARGARPGGGGSGRTAPGFDFSGFDWSTTTTPGGGSGGSSFRDIFSDLFGGGAAKEAEPPRPQPKKGADIEMPLALSFDWAPRGKVQVTGTASLKPTLTADLKTEVTDFEILPLSPYLEDFVNARITQGAISATSRLIS